MAKSMRSKWKRKCRAVKRERYAVKELARLKKMLGIKEEEKPQATESTESEVMESDQVIFLDASEIKAKKKKKAKAIQKETEAENEEDVEMSSDDEKVEVDDNGKKRVFNSKTLRDQNGQYPVWLHKRKIAKLNNNLKRKTKKKGRKGKRKI